jgi:pimeloyl-ACP methyl ester carboxylesterase
MEINAATRPVSPPSANLSILSADGLQLRMEAFGHIKNQSIVFAHGFGQTRHAWEHSAKRLSQHEFFCLTVDGRGHGDSDWLPGGQYEFDQFTDDLIRVAHYAGRKPILVGASMGGLLGMIAQAESNHDLFSAMVLVDITPRWEVAGVERIMKFMRAHPEGFDSIEAAQMAVMHYLPHREPKPPERLTKLLKRMKNGRLRWHWDPALLETVAPAANRYLGRLQSAAQQLRLPILLVSGGRSDVVSDQTIAEFRQMVPHATHCRIDHATHMIAGDDNDAFTDIMLDYFTSLKFSSTPSTVRVNTEQDHG